jgi:predicted nucleic acid-binding protein
VITAVDSSVLLDILTADARFGPASRDALKQCRREGSLIASEVVWAETAGWFPTDHEVRAAMHRLAVEFSAVTASSAERAGACWRRYRADGGTRQRLVSDFLIGAHALEQADRLLTRDRGFHRRYFSELHVLDPASPGR